MAAVSVRAALLAVALAGLLALQATRAQERSSALVVLSSLPEVLARQQVVAFEQSQPGVRVELLTAPAGQLVQRVRNRQMRGERTDVVISATPQALEALSRENLLQVVEVTSQPSLRTGADRVAGGTDHAPDAAPGIVTRVQLPLRFVLQFNSRPEAAPAPDAVWGWRVLADPQVRGRITGVGIQPPEAIALLAGVVLQAQAWQPGWRWLAQLAGNGQPTDETSQAQPGMGMSLLLLPLGSAMSETALPVLTVTVPARLGVLAGARDVRTAQRFTRFLTAQMLLERQEGLARAGGAGALAHRHDYLNLDAERLEGRHALIAVLLEQTLLVQQTKLRQILDRMDEVGARARALRDPELIRAVESARDRLLMPLLAESDIKLAPVVEAFGEGLTDTVRRARIEALEAQWRERSRSRIAEAEREAAALAARTGSRHEPGHLHTGRSN